MPRDGKVWIDPNGHTLDFLREHQQERQREEAAMRRKKEQEQAKTQASARMEILPPESKTSALKLPNAEALGLPDLSDMERQIRHAAGMLDPSKPEGWLDSWFGRPDHRLRVKTDRAQLLAGYVSACTAIHEAARVHQGTRQQIYLDQIAFFLKIAEQNLRLELLQRQIEREDSVQQAKAEAEIREQGLRGRPAPPPPPPPATPPVVDEHTRRRQAAQKERQLEYDLKLDAIEAEETHQDKIAQQALARILKAFAEPNTVRAQKRMRIRNLIDNYEIAEEALPAGVIELMEAED